MNYSLQDAITLMNKLGYPSLTDLQQKAFSNSQFLDSSPAWLFLIGATSTGKTMVPLVRYFLQYLNEEKPPRMLFAVPYRALAAQKHKEILAICEQLHLDLRVEQSTGEYRSADSAIRSGDVDIAVIIYEKVFMFASMDEDFLNHYSFLVLDEVGLTQNIARGIKADFILARAKSYHHLSVMALGTPFYDWTDYLQSFGFSTIKETRRPVDLKMFPVYCPGKHRHYISHLEPDCPVLRCGSILTYPNSPDDPNPRQWTDDILEEICTYHLKQHHKILIFINNREEVRKLAQRLAITFSRRKVVSPWTSPEECRQYILQHLNMDENDIDDDLYGVMDPADYFAFSYHIGYHNASVPNQLRTLVENEILSDNGKLAIVCCTETLAYGINSNVDVVIIPHMMKQRTEDDSFTFLTLNEFMNYAGRAGRLHPGEDARTQNGYVYPLIRAEYVDPDSSDKMEDQQTAWLSLLNELEHPLQISSHYFTTEAANRPFYLLSLFPHSAFGRTPLTEQDLCEILRHLPSSVPFDPELHVRRPLDELFTRNLICKDTSDDLFEEDCAYILTDPGVALSGYILRLDDFDKITTRFCSLITPDSIYLVDLLYTMLNSKELLLEITNSIGKLEKFSGAEQLRIIHAALEQLWEFRDLISPTFCDNIRSMTNVDFSGNKLDLCSLQIKSKKCNQLRLIAALLLWTSRHCSVKKLYDRFHLGFPQMQRLSEQVSYLLDVTRLSLPALHLPSGESLTHRIGRERLFRVDEQLSAYSNAVFFQFDQRFAQLFQIQVTTPADAEKLKQLTRIYNRLSFAEKKISRKKKLSHREQRQFRSYQKKISAMPDAWKTIFEDRFGGILHDT